jgi:hypothetical protein
VAIGEHPRVRLVDENQVVGGARAHLRGNPRAAAQRELVGVNPGLEAMAETGFENGARVVRRKHTLLAKHIAPFRQPLLRNRRDHLVDQDLDVLGAAAAVFNRHFVRAHKGRREIDWLAGRQRLDGAQDALLRGELEPVPALGLGGGGAVGEHLRQPRAREADEVMFARRARGRHRLDDAAAAGGDVGISGAGEPAAELVAAIAGEHQMGVRIDEAGDNGAAFTVDHFRIGGQRDCRRCIRRGPDKDDAALEPGHRGMGQGVDFALRAAALRRRTRARRHQVRVVDQKVSLHSGAV